MMESTDSELLQDYFYTLKRVLRPMGLSLHPNFSVGYKAYSYSILSALVVYNCLMLPDFAKISTDKEHFDYFIDTWLFGTGYMRSKINTIMNTLQSGVFAPNPKRGGEMETTLIQNCVTLTRKMSVISISVLVGTVAVCTVGYYLLYLKTGSKLLPFGSASILFNISNYELTLLYNIMAYGTIAGAFVLVDIIYSSLLAHLCVQCKILQNFTRNAIETSRRVMTEEEALSCTENSQIPYEYLQRTLKEIIVHHMAILKVADDVEEVFNIPTLGIFAGMSVCFCFIMYQGSQYPFSDPRLLKDLFVLVIAMHPLIITSYWGSEVLFESRAVADACYEIDFVGTAVKFQKALVLIIMRSQKPIKQTVGKFLTLSLVTMLGVIRLSYSYFMLLRKVNKSEDM